MAKISGSIAGILTTVIVLISSIFYISFDMEFYSFEYGKNGIYERYEKKMADEIASELIGYIKSKNDSLYYEYQGEGNIFTKREIVHMADVKSIFQAMEKVRICSAYVLALMVIISVKKVRTFSKWAVIGILISWGGFCGAVHCSDTEF